MRCHDMGAVAAVLVDAEAAPVQAHVVVVGQALLAMAAADPGVDDAQVADLDAGRLGPELAHPPDDLMPHRQRQHDAAIFQRHRLAAAEIVAAFPDVQVGVADAAMRGLQQDFRALGLGRRPFDLLQGCSVLNHSPGAHRNPPKY